MDEPIVIKSELAAVVVSDENVYVGERSAWIYFDDGSAIEIAQYHMQDCCESVYLELEPLAFLRSAFIGRKFNTLDVTKVPNQGVIFSFTVEHEQYTNQQRTVKIFCSAYNYQNGYYGTDLELTILHGTREEKIDISNCTENHFE